MTITTFKVIQIIIEQIMVIRVIETHITQTLIVRETPNYNNNNERYYNNNRGNPQNNNNGNNRFSRPRVNFIRAEDGWQRRYYHQRRNSSHEYEDRRRSRQRDEPRYNPTRRSTSLDNTERQTNREQPLDHRTERQGPTQGLSTEASILSLIHISNWRPTRGLQLAIGRQ